MTPKIDPNERYLLIKVTGKNIANPINAGIVVNTRRVPAAIAIPLPPLKLSITGQLCPTRANKVDITNMLSSMNNCLQIYITAIPFDASKHNTNSPITPPDVLKTFDVPILPLP